jgi:hypothetical protein
MSRGLGKAMMASQFDASWILDHRLQPMIVSSLYPGWGNHDLPIIIARLRKEG